MRNGKEVKRDLLAAMDAVGDEIFFGMGFKRRKGTFDYIRTIRDAQQTIAFGMDYFPKCQPSEELHLHPAMHLSMGSVTEAALQLVAGDKTLLANAPEIIVNQPIEFAAPKSQHCRWFATGFDQMKERMIEIGFFVKIWVIPFLEQLTTLDDLIEIYRSADERMLKQRHWYIFIASAYLLKGNNQDALAVLEGNLGTPGLRRRYFAAFEMLDSNS